MMSKLFFIIGGLLIASAFLAAYFIIFSEAEPLDCGRDQSCITNAILDCSPAKGILVKEQEEQEYQPTPEDVYFIGVHGKKIPVNLSVLSQEYSQRSFEYVLHVKGKTEDSCLIELIFDERTVLCEMPLGISDPEAFEELFLSSYMQRCKAA